MAKKKVSLEQIAEEMNDVMQYGRNEAGELVNEGDLIDTELSQKALKECIVQRAKEDLRPADVESFSAEVWDWFVDNDLVEDEGASDEVEDEDTSDDVTDVADASDDESDEDDEPAPPKKPAGKKTDTKPVASTPKKAQNGPSKASNGKKQADTQGKVDNAQNGQTVAKKRQPPQGAMAQGGNEKYAVSLVEEGLDFDAFHKKFANLYKEAGKTDADYIQKRARIYWGIAHKTLNRPLPDRQEVPKGKKRADNPENTKAAEPAPAKKAKK